MNGTINIVATPAGREVYIMTPNGAGAKPQLLVYHDGQALDVLGLVDYALDLPAKTQAADAPAEPPVAGPVMPRSPWPDVRSGTECYCLQCGAEGRAYGTMTSSGGTAACCGACGCNAQLVPLDKLQEFVDANAETVIMDWRWPKPMRGDSSQIPRCSGGPCSGARQCEWPSHPGCHVLDLALPALGFVKRPVLKPKGS